MNDNTMRLRRIGRWATRGVTLRGRPYARYGLAIRGLFSYTSSDILYLYHPYLAAVRPGLFVVDHRNGQYIAVVIAQQLDGDIFTFLDLFDGRFDGIVELLI